MTVTANCSICAAAIQAEEIHEAQTRMTEHLREAHDIEAQARTAPVNINVTKGGPGAPWEGWFTTLISPDGSTRMERLQIADDSTETEALAAAAVVVQRLMAEGKL